jgi:hypothetical protein
MNWVLIIWLGTPSNFTIFEKFPNEKACIEKQVTLNKALNQAGSKMQTECRLSKPGDAFKKSNITVTRYVLR